MYIPKWKHISLLSHIEQITLHILIGIHKQIASQLIQIKYYKDDDRDKETQTAVLI